MNACVVAAMTVCAQTRRRAGGADLRLEGDLAVPVQLGPRREGERRFVQLD